MGVIQNDLLSTLSQLTHLSSLLCSVVFEQIITDVSIQREAHILYKSHQLIGYADDVALVAISESELKEITERLVVGNHKTGLQLNPKVCKVISAVSRAGIKLRIGTHLVK